MPEVLQRARDFGIKAKRNETTFYLGRERVIVADGKARERSAAATRRRFRCPRCRDGGRSSSSSCRATRGRRPSSSAFRRTASSSSGRRSSSDEETAPDERHIARRRALPPGVSAHHETRLPNAKPRPTPASAPPTAVLAMRAPSIARRTWSPMSWPPMAIGPTIRGKSKLSPPMMVTERLRREKSRSARRFQRDVLVLPVEVDAERGVVAGLEPRDLALEARHVRRPEHHVVFVGRVAGADVDAVDRRDAAPFFDARLSRPVRCRRRRSRTRRACRGGCRCCASWRPSVARSSSVRRESDSIE